MVDRQLNTTALHLIQRSLTPKDLSHIRGFSTAKEAWDYLTTLFIGNESIQASKYEEISNECDAFVMLDEETPEETYCHLKGLSVAMMDLGATQTDDMWVKRKFIQALLPIDEVKCNTIKGRSDYHQMSSNAILSEVVAMTSSKKIADDARARAQGVRKVNLALKAKVVEHQEEEEDDGYERSLEETKYAYHEHMALASRGFWGKPGNKATSKGNSRGAPRGTRLRN